MRSICIFQNSRGVTNRREFENSGSGQFNKTKGFGTTEGGRAMTNQSVMDVVFTATAQSQKRFLANLKREMVQQARNPSALFLRPGETFEEGIARSRRKSYRSRCRSRSTQSDMQSTRAGKRTKPDRQSREGKAFPGRNLQSAESSGRKNPSPTDSRVPLCLCQLCRSKRTCALFHRTFSRSRANNAGKPTIAPCFCQVLIRKSCKKG